MAIELNGLIPTEISSEIIEGVRAESVVLALGRRVPMGTGVAEFPVATGFPTASFVSTGGRKPVTDFKLSGKTMKAEEIAAVVPVPQALLDDSSINLWDYVQPLLTDAISVALDKAVIYGTGAPPSFPAGGIAATAMDVPPGADALASVNAAMAAVEDEGLPVTANAADNRTRAALRNLRDASGALLLGPAQAENAAMSTIYGVPTMFAFYLQEDFDFITGDWEALIIGVRQDIRFDMSNDGVLADDDGKVVISAFQDDTVLLRVYARFGCVLAKPVTPVAPDGAEPFAVTTIRHGANGGGAEGPGGGAGGGGEEEAALRRQAPAKKAAATASA